jgi:hypothetical protein
MLQLDNTTPFAAQLTVFPDAAGVETAYLAVKATFELTGGEPRVAAVQPALRAADGFWGDPASSSLREVGELHPAKPSTDVLLVGRAIAPQPDTHIADVRLSVGPVAKTVRVFGDRRWQRRGSGWRPGEPAAWERMPLRWELAFGSDATNPVGRGLIDAATLDAQALPLPNLEDPAALIEDESSRPAPACFAPVAPGWLGRRVHAGTYDKAWSEQRAPYLPADFDSRYFQLATPDLVSPQPLSGGESVELAGVTRGAPLRFTLPRVDFETVFHFAGAALPRPMRLETVLFEPDAGRMQMLWRSHLAVDKKLLRLRQVELHGKHHRPPTSAGAAPAPAMA